MRIGVYFLFIFLIGCSAESQTLLLEEVLNNQLSKPVYEFSLTEENAGKVNVFEGQQKKSDWLVQNKAKKLNIEKKGTQIIMTVGEMKEVLTRSQLGLISPNDHLLLIKELGEQVKYTMIDIDKKRMIQMEATINPQKLSKKLSARLLSEGKNGSPHLSLSDKVSYRLDYDPQAKKLLRFSVKIHMQKKSIPQLSYVFK